MGSCRALVRGSWQSEVFNQANFILIKTRTPAQACGISTELFVKSLAGDFFETLFGLIT